MKMLEMEGLLTAPFSQTLKESEGDQEEAKRGERFTGDEMALHFSSFLQAS